MRSSWFLGAVVLTVPAVAHARGSSICGEHCSPAMDATVGYILPTALHEIGPNGYALPTANAQVTANVALDIRLVFGHLLVPLAGVSFHGGLAPLPHVMRDPGGNSLTVSPLTWATLLLPGVGVATHGTTAAVRAAVTTTAESVTVETPRFGPAHQTILAPGFGVVGDLSTCVELGFESRTRQLRACLVVQPALFENAVTIESGVRLTAW